MPSTISYSPLSTASTPIAFQDVTSGRVKFIQYQNSEERIGGVQTPHCLAAETLVRFYGLPFDELESNNKHNLSAGTLPCIEDVDGTIASGVDGINKHLRESRGDVLDAHLLAVDHANGKALKKNLEDHMHWITLYYRWYDKKGWKFFKKHLLKKMGKLAKMFGGLLARKPMKKSLEEHGTVRMSPVELNRIAIQIFTQVKSVIGNRKFLFGDRPSSYDAEVFAYTAIWMMWPISHPIKRFLMESDCLSDYVHRVSDAFFADGGGIGKLYQQFGHNVEADDSDNESHSSYSSSSSSSQSNRSSRGSEEGVIPYEVPIVEGAHVEVTGDGDIIVSHLHRADSTASTESTESIKEGNNNDGVQAAVVFVSENAVDNTGEGEMFVVSNEHHHDLQNLHYHHHHPPHHHFVGQHDHHHKELPHFHQQHLVSAEEGAGVGGMTAHQPYVSAEQLHHRHPHHSDHSSSSSASSHHHHHHHSSLHHHDASSTSSSSSSHHHGHDDDHHQHHHHHHHHGHHVHHHNYYDKILVDDVGGALYAPHERKFVIGNIGHEV